MFLSRRTNFIFAVLAGLMICSPTCAADSGGDLPPLPPGMPQLRPPQKVVPLTRLRPLDLDVRAEWHVVRMQLRGSLCPACLLELQRDLSLLPGVQGVNIKQSKTEHGNELRLGKFANAVFVINEYTISPDDLRSEIKKKDYAAAHVEDERLPRLPTESDLDLPEAR